MALGYKHFVGDYCGIKIVLIPDTELYKKIEESDTYRNALEVEYGSQTFIYADNITGIKFFDLYENGVSNPNITTEIAKEVNKEEAD